MPDANGRIAPVAIPAVPWHEQNAAAVERVERIIADFEAMDRRRQRCVSPLELVRSLREALGKSEREPEPEPEFYCGD